MRNALLMRKSLLAGVVAIGSVLIASASTAGGATAGNTVTYSATITIPTPPASNFAGSGGGDGWGLAFTPTAVYNVFHHQDTLQVACHLQVDASACYSPVTISDTDMSNAPFATEAQPGVTIDPATGHLYVFAELSANNSAGVVCVDTTQSPAAFCGYTQLTADGDAPQNDGISAVSDPVQVGDDWYAFNAVDGTPSGTKDTLMCFDIAQDAPCATQNYPVNLGASPSVTDISFPGPSIAYIGGEILIPANLSGSAVIACFDPSSGTDCGGNWPISTTTLDYPAAANGIFGGAPFPLLDANGNPIGLCLPITNDPCFDLAGNSVTTPTGLASAVTPNESWDGTALTIGARVYVPDSTAGDGTDTVACYDYNVQAECANFPHVLPNLSLLYTVNADPQRPTCIWVNSDGEDSGQIQNFDAYTGGACGTGSIRVLASSVVVPMTQCLPANYTSLQVLNPPASAYANGTVQFEDFDGNPIPSIPGTQPLVVNADNTSSINLTPFNLSTVSALPQFVVTLPGATASSVEIKLTWTGTYSSNCTSANVTTSAPPPSLPSGQGYRLAASDGGVFAFGTRQFYGSATNGGALDAPVVGMAATSSNHGYWLTASDGGVFSVGDAQFWGSLPQHHTHPAAPIAGIASTPDDLGYWLVGQDGGVFTFGDAQFYGSLPSLGIKPNKPAVAIAPTPDGKGYWIVSADGGVFSFGDAQFYGSVLSSRYVLNGTISGIARTSDGHGYWLVGRDGGVLSFGDAVFYGSLPQAGIKPHAGIVGIAATPDGKGYWLAGADGGVFAFPDATYLGSLALSPLNAPVVAITG